MAFSRDDRPARCACGWQGTMSQVLGHRSRKVYASCLSAEPTYLDADEQPPQDADEREDDAGERVPAGGVEGSRTEGGPWRPRDADAMAVPPTKTRGIGGRPDVGHINGYTPVKGQYTFPAQMYALYDYFVAQTYEGTFQDWVTEIVLKCCADHYRLRFGVYVERPEPASNGVRHG